MSLLDIVLGKPLASSDERAEQIGVSAGIPIFGLDALSSAAYGPEAAMTLLIPLGLVGVNYVMPLSLCIITLLLIVFFSYRQTIAAYPQGGGSYTVAHENLGTFPGLLAATALMIDYVLTAAVGISAGIGALVSAEPKLLPHRLALCLAALVILTIVNLRGVREAGGVFMLPTYLFLLCMFAAIAITIMKAVAGGGHAVPVVAPPAPTHATEAVSIWLLLKAFSSGCTALTGVEAVSNGVRAFHEPRIETAQRTLGVIILALVLMLGGIAYGAHVYKIAATDPNGQNYQSVLSMLLLAVAGRNWFYFVSIISILLVLIFSANTAFADFPRVCHVLSEDYFLPLSFANRGRRLVYSEGIAVLAALTGFLLIIFDGVTDRLIPLYAVGAFLAFTLSQAGMVKHWLRNSENGIRWGNVFVNALGAFCTGITVIVVAVTKFMDGAWITILLIPAMLILMYRVRSHYQHVKTAISSDQPIDLGNLQPPLVVIPMPYWSLISQKALRHALEISTDIKVLHVAVDDQPDKFCQEWKRLVTEPAERAGLHQPELVQLHSPFRFVVMPIVNFVCDLARQNPNRRIVTIVPELVERKWYAYFLHTQRALLLKASLLMNGNDQISVLNIPWYLERPAQSSPEAR